MSAIAEEVNLAALEVTIGLRGDTFAYTVAGGATVDVLAIYKPGFVDGTEVSAHALLEVLPGARTDSADTLHLPTGASDNGDTILIDGTARKVLDITRRRNRYTRITVQN